MRIRRRQKSMNISKMKNTLIIAFNAGAYGTYLEWVLNSLLTDQPLKAPFTQNGNSHATQLGIHLHNMTGFQRYVKSEHNFVTARLHPKTKRHHNLRQNLEEILEHVPRLILLYPDKTHELMCVGNYMTKIWSCHPYKTNLLGVDHKEIYQKWNVPPDTDLCALPLWIQREHMSYYLFDAWRDQVEWFFPDKWQHHRAMIVYTKDLFDDFTNTLERIQDFWGMPYKKNPSEMIAPHIEMIKLQPYLDSDQSCWEIIKTTLDPTLPTIEFGNIDLIKQSWIQHHLRNHGYELKCNDLNIFPTDTIHLRSLIYRYHSN